ncbi:hypothetical protein BCR44DRAFT_347922 [Catenaria anguillulae PL171]|uniref:Uncharacterized protein n=1 Tax=Catenaria anguillulae PL171 TaxID=765915 RepID=A0A1Y2I2Q6_9FUNG|nr:hypothetical protein BCR44DRAFT_347922 [Catenaria anguillulae PL171]
MGVEKRMASPLLQISRNAIQPIDTHRGKLYDEDINRTSPTISFPQQSVTMVGLFLEKLEPLAAKSLHPHANSSLHNEVPASAFQTSGPMGMVFMTAAEIDRARHMEALLRLTALKLSIAMYHPNERSKKLKLRARLAPHRDELRALFIYRQETTSAHGQSQGPSESGRLSLPTPRRSPAEETCPTLPTQHRTLSGDALESRRRRRSPSPHPIFSAASESSLSAGSTSTGSRPNRHQLHIPLDRARSYSPTRGSSRSPTALTCPPPLTFPAPPSPTPAVLSSSSDSPKTSKPRLRSKSPAAWIKSKLPRNLLDRISPVEERENWFDDLEDDFDGTLEGIMEDEAWLPVTPEGEYPPVVVEDVAVAEGDSDLAIDEDTRLQRDLEPSEQQRKQNEMATKAAAVAEEHDLGHDLKWRLEELIGKGVIGTYVHGFCHVR